MAAGENSERKYGYGQEQAQCDENLSMVMNLYEAMQWYFIEGYRMMGSFDVFYRRTRMAGFSISPAWTCHPVYYESAFTEEDVQYLRERTCFRRIYSISSRFSFRR